MKKYLLTFLSLSLMVGVTYSQKLEGFKYTESKYLDKELSKKADRPAKTNNYSAKTTVIWSNEFDDVNDWNFFNSSSVHDAWVFTTDDYTQSIQGGTPFERLESTTNANGYAIINSDDAYEGDGEGNLVGELTNVTPIDLTGFPEVVLTFEHNYRWWNDTRGVRVSGDNGVTWEEFEITDEQGYPNDQNSANPEFEVIDISEVAGDSAEVLIQFFYDDNNFWGWYWAIDDVKITEKPENDLEVVSAPWGTSLVQVFTNVDALPIDARNIPEQQTSEIDFYADIYNFGTNNQTNIEYSIDVNNGDFTDQIVIPEIVSDDSVTTSISFTPSGTGLYTVNREIEAAEVDENPANNEFDPVEIEVNDQFIYARDDGSDERSFGIVDETIDFYMFYEIFEPQQLAFVRIGVAEGSENLPSDPVSFVVTITDASDGTEIGASQLIVMENDDLGTEMVIPVTDFNGNYLTLTPGIYEIKTETQEPNMRLSGGGSINQATAYFEIKSGPDAGAFGSFSSAPRIRLDFNPSVSVQDEEFNESNLVLYPNPASQNANLEFELMNESEVRINVVDVTGKQVYSENMNTLNSGNHKIKVNTSNFKEGIYFVTLNTEGTKTTKKLVVKK